MTRQARSILLGLILALPALLVSFTVVMAFYLLIVSVGDNWGAQALLAVGVAILVILSINLLLLVGILSVDLLTRSDRAGARPSATDHGERDIDGVRDIEDEFEEFEESEAFDENRG